MSPLTTYPDRSVPAIFGSIVWRALSRICPGLYTPSVAHLSGTVGGVVAVGSAKPCCPVAVTEPCQTKHALAAAAVIFLLVPGTVAPAPVGSGPLACAAAGASAVTANTALPVQTTNCRFICPQFPSSCGSSPQTLIRGEHRKLRPKSFP